MPVLFLGRLLMRKISAFLGLVYILTLFGCSQEPTIQPSIPTNTPTTDDKTYLQIENNSQFDINVYLQSPSYADPYAKVKVNESVKKEISASSTLSGDSIYIQYLYPIGNIVIPYYDVSNESCVKIRQIEEKTVNTLKITSLNSLSVNKKYFIIRNESNDPIALSTPTNSFVTPLYKESYWIPADDYRVYELNDISSLSGYKLGNGLSNKSIDIDAISDGNIYTVRYSNSSSIDLISVSPIDISTRNKIWKIPLSQETGKFLRTDKFGPRENLSNGYFYTGQIAYNINCCDVESVPYRAEISVTGEIADSTLSFAGSPVMVASNCFIEKNGKMIIAGNKRNSTSDKNDLPFIYGDKGCEFSITPELEHFSVFSKIIHKEENTFSLLYETYDETTEKQGFGIYELTINSYDDPHGQVVYTNTDLNFWDINFIHYNGEYLVMYIVDSDDDETYDSTTFTFIDDTTYEIKTDKSQTLRRYTFNALEKNTEETLAVASGSYTSSVTGKDSASFIQIDLTTSTFLNNGTPLKFESTDSNLNSNFESLAIKGNECFFGGYIDRDYNAFNSGTNSGYPYIISYDLISQSQKWSNIYTDLKGFHVFSCDLSAIGTPLIELYNKNTGMSFMASCGLLGEIPENELSPLPRNTRITNVKVPDIIITLVDNNGDEHEISVSYGTNLSLSDLNAKLDNSFAIPDTKEISSWKYADENGNVSNNYLSFPITVINNCKLFPEFSTQKVRYYVDDLSGTRYVIAFEYGTEVTKASFRSALDLTSYVFTALSENTYYTISDWYCSFPFTATTSSVITPKVAYETVGVWENTYNGTYYFVDSGNSHWISNNTRQHNTTAQSSWEINLLETAYNYYIYYGVDSEANYDTFTLTLDGTIIVSDSGYENNWVVVTLTTGNHTLTAKYSKDSSGNSGSDYAYINIEPIDYSDF